VCDEPISALDVSIQAQILNLFEDLRGEYGLSYLFITHDLAIAKHVSDRIAVMYLGKVVELSDASSIFRNPLHAYSAALLSARPDPDVASQREIRSIRLEGDLPLASNPPSGYRFRTRCPYAQDVCTSDEPPLQQFSATRSVACHFPFVADGASASSSADLAVSASE
jgi:oligopeptide/dipeptide ABC transporter ATP-binding protein